MRFANPCHWLLAILRFLVAQHTLHSFGRGVHRASPCHITASVSVQVSSMSTSDKIDPESVLASWPLVCFQIHVQSRTVEIAILMR
jgi:hypothetical protein